MWDANFLLLASFSFSCCLFPRSCKSPWPKGNSWLASRIQDFIFSFSSFARTNQLSSPQNTATGQQQCLLVGFHFTWTIILFYFFFWSFLRVSVALNQVSLLAQSETSSLPTGPSICLSVCWLSSISIYCVRLLSTARKLLSKIAIPKRGKKKTYKPSRLASNGPKLTGSVMVNWVCKRACNRLCNCICCWPKIAKKQRQNRCTEY